MPTKPLSAVAAAVAEIAPTTALHVLDHSGDPKTELADACAVHAANATPTPIALSSTSSLAKAPIWLRGHEVAWLFAIAANPAATAAYSPGLATEGAI